MLTASGSTSSQGAKRTLAPAPGVTPPPTDGSSYRFLSDVIIARGLVQPAAMKAALQASLAGRSLTEILVDNGELSEDDLARTLAEHHRLDHVDLDVFAVDDQATALVEPDVARRFGAVPIAVLESGAVVVALYDPNGSTAVLEFAGLTDRVIQPAVASRTQIEALIASLREGGRRPLAARAAAPAAESHLHSVRAESVAVPADRDPADYARSTPPAQAEHAAPTVHAAPVYGGPQASAPGYSDPHRPAASQSYGNPRSPASPPGSGDPRPPASPPSYGAPHAPALPPGYGDPHPPASPPAYSGPPAPPAEATAAPAPTYASTRAPAGRGDDRASYERRIEELRERAETAERRNHEADERAETAERRNHDADERAETAERRTREADERARAVEDRVRTAEERARAAEEQTRLAEARARASEERALAAGELVDAAEARAEGMSSAADAANETLARLVRACETLEHEARSRGPEIDVLRAALDAERSQRLELETQLRHPPPSDQLTALQERIAELERALADQRAAAASPPPPAGRAVPAASARAAPPPPEATVEVEVEAEGYLAPSIAPMIDIVGEPGVPYVSALAPMPSNEEPRKAPKSTTAKARGLRRLISAIKRGA